MHVNAIGRMPRWTRFNGTAVGNDKDTKPPSHTLGVSRFPGVPGMDAIYAMVIAPHLGRPSLTQMTARERVKAGLMTPAAAAQIEAREKLP